MWHNTRRGFNLIRKRYDIRKFKLNLVSTLAIITCVCIIAASIYFVTTVNSVKNKAKNIGGNEPTNEANIQVDIYDNDNDDTDKEKDDDKNIAEKKLTVIALGDIMMGGEVGKNLNFRLFASL